MREFDTGATRDDESDKLDFEGFVSPAALTRYAQYMHQHRTQADGKLRDSDNWQKGIPLSSYMKSLVRHVVNLWKLQRWFNRIELDDQLASNDEYIQREDLLCAILFNTFGQLHELLKED